MTDPTPTPAPADGAPVLPRRQALMIAVAGVAASAGMGLAWWHQRGTAGVPPGITAAALPGDATALQSLWALKLERPEGGELALATLRGKPLLINFWATWCAPCVREMPEIDRFHREFGPRGWQVLGLAIDGPTPVREFLARVKVGFPVALAGLDGTDLVQGLGNAAGGLPFSVLISAQGQVLQRKLGETRFDELAAWASRG